jgi:hypothetical protein
LFYHYQPPVKKVTSCIGSQLLAFAQFSDRIAMKVPAQLPQGAGQAVLDFAQGFSRLPTDLDTFSTLLAIPPQQIQLRTDTVNELCITA